MMRLTGGEVALWGSGKLMEIVAVKACLGLTHALRAQSSVVSFYPGNRSLCALIPGLSSIGPLGQEHLQLALELDHLVPDDAAPKGSTQG